MASEYLKWKYRNEKPEDRRQLTPEEQRKNWWHYHKWYIAIGVALAGIVVSILWYTLGVGQVRPDYQIAYVGENALPSDTAAAIEAAFAALGEDLNGDGRVTVQLHQYAFIDGTDAEIAVAASMNLMADILHRDSYFFLLDDPEWFQANYCSLRRLDGSLPEEEDYSAEGTYLPWNRCPALAETELGDYAEPVLGQTLTGSSDELVSGLFLARRGFWGNDACQYVEGCDALWDRLTDGYSATVQPPPPC